MLWIPITLAGALFQVWRTAEQSRLRALLSASGAGFVRYVFALPVDLAALGAALVVSGAALPGAGWRFFAFAAAGGLAQVIGTVLLIMAFGLRNFAAGTAYAKTEALQLALLAWLLFGEGLGPLAWAGIAVSVTGMLALSLAGAGIRPAALLRALGQPAALVGLGAGFAFALTAVFIKAGLGALDGSVLLVRALFTLAVTNALQTAMQGAWLAWRDRETLAACFRHWRRTARVGVLSALGSGCWFTAFALTEPALVRGLGQVEVLLTLGFGRFYLRERIRPADRLGLLLVGAGVVLIVLGGG